ncbi:Rrf2 family transcriptional regulator [Pseudothermotoga sp.]|uniref:RrF2 family transcriptional regulator n=1 Tax=Pseudothermotoga sp. TaxID=2033661 RepID=UPI0031F64313
MKLGITVKSEYAFRILLSIGGCGNKLVSLADASRNMNVPKEFAEKIVLQLRKAGIVKAKRGRSGGYELAKSASQITAYDIVTAVDDVDKIIKCEQDFCGCEDRESCVIKNVVWNKLQRCIKEVLTSVTLQDLLNACGREG